MNETGLQSPIVKNIHVSALKSIIEKTGATNGDVVFFGADKEKTVNEALGALRLKIGHEKNHVDGRAWAPLWIVDFPMFEHDEETDRWVAIHHPFTAPKEGDGRSLQKSSFDHVAFRTADYLAVLKKLKKLNVPFDEKLIPGMSAHQIFLRDPAGNRVELNFKKRSIINEY